MPALRTFLPRSTPALLAVLAAAPALALPQEPEAILGRLSDGTLFSVEHFTSRGGPGQEPGDYRNAVFFGFKPHGDLRGADFRGKILDSAYLCATDCREADFRGVDLRTTVLDGANLEGANLDGARILAADADRGHFRGVDLSGVLWFRPATGAEAMAGPAPLGSAAAAEPPAAASSRPDAASSGPASSEPAVAPPGPASSGPGPAPARTAPVPLVPAAPPSQASPFAGSGIPAEPDTQNPAWNGYLDLVRQFQAESGQCLVPVKFITNSGVKLGAWVSRQRHLYAIHDPGLTDDKIKALEAIPGWVWAARRSNRPAGRMPDASQPRHPAAEPGWTLKTGAGTTKGEGKGEGKGQGKGEGKGKGKQASASATPGPLPAMGIAGTGLGADRTGGGLDGPRPWSRERSRPRTAASSPAPSSGGSSSSAGSVDLEREVEMVNADGGSGPAFGSPSPAPSSYAFTLPPILGGFSDGRVLLAWDFPATQRLDGVVLVGRPDLRGADFSGKTLANANLGYADCTGARFNGVDLRTTQLGWANLTGADFTGATLRVQDIVVLLARGINLGGAQIATEAPGPRLLAGSGPLGAAPLAAAAFPALGQGQTGGSAFGGRAGFQSRSIPLSQPMAAASRETGLPGGGPSRSGLAVNGAQPAAPSGMWKRKSPATPAAGPGQGLPAPEAAGAKEDGSVEPPAKQMRSGPPSGS